MARARKFVTSIAKRFVAQAAPEVPDSERTPQRPAPRLRLVRPVPTGTTGPCLSCQCRYVDVNLLDTFVRYCQCPECGSAWTEPAKSRPVDGDAAHFPSEPLKFLRDRN